MRRTGMWLLFSLGVLATGLAAQEADLEAEYDRTARRGAKRDQFPVLTDPKMTPAAKAKDIRDDEPVIGVAIGKEAQAYPMSVMGVHELVNTRCGKAPIAVSW